MLELQDMKEALHSSGYLLESRIISQLDAKSFFIRPNDSFADPVSGKSREIDLFAESQGHFRSETKSLFCIHLVVECINNSFPLVLFKRKSFRDSDDILGGLRYFQTNIPKIVDLDAYEIGFRSEYVNNFMESGTQYCSFTYKKGQKKDELMASHPDDLNSIFGKLVAYIEQQIQDISTRFKKKDDFFRLWMLHPVIVLQNEIYEADVVGDSVELNEVEEYPFEYNYSDGTKRFLFITVVRERAFNAFLEKCERVEGLIGDRLVEYEKRPIP